MEAVRRTISIEELVERHPAAVGFLIRQGLPCLVCGEPEWGTLEEMAARHGRSAEQIERLVLDLNRELQERT